MAAILNDDGALAGAAVITRDVAERRLADVECEGQLHSAIESNRVKDDVLATIVHELRTPLNAIAGWVQLLRRQPSSLDAYAAGLDVIERNVQTQVRLVDDLLDSYRMTTGKIQLRLAPVQLAPIVAAALDMLLPIIEKKHVEVVVDLVPDGVEPTELVADAVRLQQVMTNLLSNAIKFTPCGGRIVLSSRHEIAALEVRVQDWGAGIPSDFLPFAFERFRQASMGESCPNSGLGLGLSIVKHIVELHGGTVSLESDGPGSGTVACVRLPLPS